MSIVTSCEGSTEERLPLQDATHGPLGLSLAVLSSWQMALRTLKFGWAFGPRDQRGVDPLAT